MPRSRNNRSTSPLKNVTSEKALEEKKRLTYENVKEIFPNFDADIISIVLEECSWNGN